MDIDSKYDRRSQYVVHSEKELTEKVSALIPEVSVVASRNLLGGFANTNTYLELNDGRRMVARFPQSGSDRLDLECAILKKYEGVLPVPKVYGANQEMALVEFVEGVLLSEFDFSDRKGWLEALRSVGSSLAKVHQMKFEQAGFLASDLTLAHGFENGVGHAYVDYIEGTLRSDTVKERMGEQLNQQALALLPTLRSELAKINEACLIHSDFNPKNILVKKTDQGWGLAAIIDWEFAHIGSSLTDLGNFFRFAHEYPEGSEEAFFAGYGQPVDQWHRLARMLDLASMCNFLERAENAPKTQATAKMQMQQTFDLMRRIQ